LVQTKKKNMTWIKKYWEDPTFRAFTFALIFGGPAFDTASWYFNGYWDASATIISFSVLVLMYVIAYLKRNSP
jgi:hypothetical protein